MGVDVSTHLVYGIKLDLKKFEKEFNSNFPEFEDGYYEFLEKEIEGNDDREFDVVVDFMSGKYIVIGHGLMEQSDQWDETFYTIGLDNLPNRDTLVSKINDRLKTNYTIDDFKLMFFNNFH